VPGPTEHLDERQRAEEPQNRNTSPHRPDSSQVNSGLSGKTTYRPCRHTWIPGGPDPDPVDRIGRGDNAARLVWPFLGVPAAAVAVHLAFAWSGHEAQSPLALWSPWAFIEIVVGAVGPLVWLRCLVLRTHRLA
jgi:hypothetical protein